MSKSTTDLFEILFFSLNRIQYPSSPEVIQSDLAWNISKAERVKEKNRAGKDIPVGYVYEKVPYRRELKKVIRKGSKPDEKTFYNSLTNNGISLASNSVQPELLSEAIIDSFKGVKSERGKFYPTSAIFTETLLAMDKDGMSGASAPALATIIEQLYSLGFTKNDTKGSAVVTWYKSIHGNINDKFYTRLRSAVKDSSIVPDHVQLPNVDDVEQYDNQVRMPMWMESLDTPFKWFAESWDALCNNEWNKALPRRRWSDWANCLLRLVIGMGFLWESRFFRTLGVELLDDSTDAEESQQRIFKNAPLINWLNENDPVTARDVNKTNKQLEADGHYVRQFIITNILEPHKEEIEKQINDWNENDYLLNFIKFSKDKLSSNSGLKEKLKACFGGKINRSINNIDEAVNYSLDCRKRFGEDADYYSLLKRVSRRYLVVSPGPELLVVLSSLTAGRPGAQTPLHVLRKKLSCLGLEPSRSILVEELEKIGLCQSSHDADDGITVNSGFKLV